MDILLANPTNSDNKITNEEAIARYVINILSIRKMIIEDRKLLSNSPFILQICKNYPFLSSINGEQFFYVAQGAMPTETTN